MLGEGRIGDLVMGKLGCAWVCAWHGAWVGSCVMAVVVVVVVMWMVWWGGIAWVFYKH